MTRPFLESQSLITPQKHKGAELEESQYPERKWLQVHYATISPHSPSYHIDMALTNYPRLCHQSPLPQLHYLGLQYPQQQWPLNQRIKCSQHHSCFLRLRLVYHHPYSPLRNTKKIGSYLWTCKMNTDGPTMLSPVWHSSLPLTFWTTRSALPNCCMLYDNASKISNLISYEEFPQKTTLVSIQYSITF